MLRARRPALLALLALVTSTAPVAVSAAATALPSAARALTAPTPVVVGSAVYGTRVSVRTGTWTTGTRLSYQWLVDGNAVRGATATTFPLTAVSRDRRVAVRVTGTKAGYTTVARVSAATPRVATVSTPSVLGSSAVTYTLTARPNTWTAGTAFFYRWYANGAALNATTSRLTLSSALVGKRITVRIAGAKAGYPTVARTSAATAAVVYPARTEPITGTWNCPSWAPIKGNADSMIYHVPGGSFYTRTNPEECFRTESAAQAAGYRRSKV